MLQTQARAWRAAASATLAAALLVVITGCGHKRVAQASVPPAPSIEPGQPSPTTTEPEEPSVMPPEDHPRHGRPLYVEVGWASWYGPSYNHRRAANGEVYNQDGLTAAHLTIPLNAVARVTNLKTGESVTVRITDRGPFVPNRIIDLSKGAAKRVGVYQHGTAKVRIEVLQSPAAINQGGRWAVQMGAFDNSDTARKVKQRLMREYRDARVLEFAGPRHDWWVRVRVPNDNKREAQEVARKSRVPEGGVYLVRLN